MILFIIKKCVQNIVDFKIDSKKMFIFLKEMNRIKFVFIRKQFFVYKFIFHTRYTNSQIQYRYILCWVLFFHIWFHRVFMYILLFIRDILMFVFVSFRL